MPTQWSGEVAIIVLTQWGGTVAILVCVGCILFYSIVDGVHPVEWSGGHYSVYPVEWHGDHYSVFGCMLFYSILNGFLYARQPPSRMCLPSGVGRWPL